MLGGSDRDKGQRFMTWHAVYTEPRREALARDELTSRGMLVFFPHESVTRRIKQRRRNVWKTEKVLEPIWPRYLFADVACDDHMVSLMHSRGVTDVVRSGGVPIGVSALLINRLRLIAGPEGLTRSRDLSKLSLQLGWKIGDEVVLRMSAGAFGGHRGFVESLARLDTKGEVGVVVGLFGRPTTVMLSYEDVEPVKAAVSDVVAAPEALAA